MNPDDYPKDLKYNKDYSWVMIDGKTATFGIIGSCAKKVKEFVFINLSEKGKDIKSGDIYVSVEAIKWSGHLSSPLSGKIIDVNDSLFDEPEKINKDPYGSWIVRLELKDLKDVQNLMDYQEARRYYEEEQ